MNNATTMVETVITLHFGPTVRLVPEYTIQVPAETFRAFAIVDPKTWGRKDWRDRIAAVLHPSDLAAAGVTIEQVKEAIVFYTGTAATVTEATTSTPGELVHVVKADGYRVGPCGP